MPIVFKSCAIFCLAILSTCFEYYIAISENEISTVSVTITNSTTIDRRAGRYLNIKAEGIQDGNEDLQSNDSNTDSDDTPQEKPSTYDDVLDTQEVTSLPMIYDYTPENSPVNLDPEESDQAESVGVIDSWTYTWNKTFVSPVDYQQSYCPRRCLDGNIVSVNNVYDKCPRDKCYECQCQRPACEVYGICCPDVSEPNIQLPGVRHSYLQPESNRPGSWSGVSESDMTKLGCGVDKLDRTFLYIRSCPGNYSGGDKVVRRCVDDFDQENATVDTFTRVMDATTNVVYWNVFCAECNGVANVQALLVQIQCKNYMAVYKATTADQFLRSSLKEESTCSSDQEFPSGLHPLSCDPVSVNARVVDKCPPISPEIQDYEHVVDACRNLNGHIYQISNSYGFFKNIFCAICHTNGYPTYSDEICVRTGWLQSEPAMPAFSLLLNFGKGSYQAGSTKRLTTSLFHFANCSETEWAHPDGQCVPLECTPGKLLVNGTCHSVFSAIKGLGYVLRLWLFPRTINAGATKAETINISINSAFENMLKKLNEEIFYMSEDNSIELGLVADDIVNQEHYEINRPNFMWLEARLIATRLLSRDEFESNMLGTLNNAPFEVEVTAGVNVTFEPLFLPDNIPGNMNCDHPPDVENSQNCAVIHLISFGIDRADMKPFYNSYLNMSNVLNCSFVTFNRNSYKLSVDRNDVIPKLSLTLDLNITTLLFKDMSELNMLALEGDGSLHVCNALLNKKLLELEGIFKLISTPSDGIDLNTRVQYILTLVCLGASMLSLLLTLLTYFRFQVLRTPAGRNNIFLSSSLLLAQSSLLASSHLSGPSPLCTALGVTTHFLWLWMFTWTFICSYRMFSVFTAKTRSSFTSSTKENVSIARDFILSTLAPSVVVVAVVVTSYVTSDGLEIGYGRWTCYLNTELLTGTAMIGPLTVVTTCNVLLFVITVIKISNVRKLMKPDSKKSEDRQNLLVYVKLSTLTGAFWIIGVLGQAFDTDILRYTSILLNGLQGVFLFLSYICNKRVLNLYTKSLATGEPFMSSSGNPHRSNTARAGMSKTRDEPPRDRMAERGSNTSTYSISKTE